MTCKRAKFWLINGGKGRRFCNQLMCRLPLLTLWTLVVIFMLYKSLSDIEVKTSEDEGEAQEIVYKLEENVANTQKQFVKQTGEKLDYPNYNAELGYRISDYDHELMTRIPNQKVSTTTKQSAEEYVRQSKVFILIVQDEDLRRIKPLKSAKRTTYRNSPFSSSSSNPQLESINLNHRFTIPAHIRYLIGILESHRIEYTIDTTRTGLPTTLLTDQDRENKQYSVIVIDDFVKYTKLSRWARDQLDRHCRTNQIGVVTYLTFDVNVDHFKLDTSHRRKRTSNHIVTQAGGTSTTEESLTNQFPLTIKPLNQQSCQKPQVKCLFDYQLNTKSSILRILKRRPNFIIKGPLIENLNHSPWMSMSSNHITYEPLTWAQYRQPTAHHDPSLAIARESHSSSRIYSTQEKNQSLSDNKTNQHASDYKYSDTKDEINGGSHRDQDQSSKHTFVRKDYYENQSTVAYDIPHSMGMSDISPPLHETSSSKESQTLNDDKELRVLAMFDHGLYDGIKRVIFGGANHHWLNRILLLDAIEHLSSGKILDPLERYIQIDIDDIFVGEKGKRMNKSDVEALIETQRVFAKRIDGGFKFNLGFSGKYFKHGHESEIAGDEELVSRANEFTWFCHTWSHSKAHLSNNTQSIVNELQMNLKFSQEFKLPIIGYNTTSNYQNNPPPPTYAVAPHHSGVYPIHGQLYDAWRNVLNVQVTSTEEYPSLRPASGRRAFVHKAIKVLPRQTCGLYTHTIRRDKYPGGITKLDALINGGELFETILHNPVNIYMTHMSNYAIDRLGSYTFSALLDFVQTNTNLQLRYAPSSSNQLGPSILADHYFNLYPNERQPLWTNPCSDKRHLAIWASSKHNYCNSAPKLIIVGPQKTGTTALYSYLKINPFFKSSQISNEDFEEIQFFNDKHYSEGVDWYFSRFTNESNKTTQMNSNRRRHLHDFVTFDKSATYFDDPKVPERASKLLPRARIVMILINPADRAYSWYQHIKAHGDMTANSFSFEQIITSREDDPKVSSAVRSLRSRCLHPGYYSQHLSRWLEHYPSNQIIIIDGQWFRLNPASVMNRLQLILRVEQPLDYNKLLVYDNNKGFFCHKSSDGNNQTKTNCLGKSKGRKYPAMSQKARLFLNRQYYAYNRQLARILSEIGQPLPTWLEETMSVSSHIRSVVY